MTFPNKTLYHIYVKFSSDSAFIFAFLYHLTKCIFTGLISIQKYYMESLTPIAIFDIIIGDIR